MMPLPLLGCLLSSAPTWTPARLATSPGRIFWARPRMASTLTLTGAQIDVMADAAGGSDVLVATGSPELDLAHGLPAIVLGAADELKTVTGGVASPTAPHEIYMVCDFDVAAEDQPVSLAIVGATGNNSASPISLRTDPAYCGGDTRTYEPHSTTPAVDGQPHIISAHYTGAWKYIGLDGHTLEGSSAVFEHAYNLAAGFGFGKFEAKQMNGSRIREAVFVFGEQLTPAEAWQLKRYLAQEHALPTLPPAIKFLGDSLTYGTDTSAEPTTGYAHRAFAAVNAALTTAGRTNAVLNLDAVSGRRLYPGSGGYNASLSDMRTRAEGSFTLSGQPASQWYSAVGASTPMREWQICCLLGGHNDLINGGSLDGTTSTDIITRLTNIAQTMTDAGWHVIISTLPPGNASDPYIDGPTLGPERAAVNSWILGSAVATGCCAAVCDIESAGLSYPADYGVGPNPLHPYDGGAQKMANAITPVIMSLIPVVA